MIIRQKKLVENYLRKIVRKVLKENAFKLTPFEQLPSKLQTSLKDEEFYSDLSLYELEDAFNEFVSMFGDYPPRVYSKIFNISMNQVKELVKGAWSSEDEDFDSYWSRQK